MAKYKMTVIKDFPGEKIYVGDSIIVEASHDSAINTNMVRQALKEQLGKQMCSGYSSCDGHWKVSKL